MNSIVGFLKDKFSKRIVEKNEPKKEIFYLISAAGIPNFGDDMLTRGWITSVKKQHPGCIIYVDVTDPVVAQSLFSDVICVDYLWLLSKSLGDNGSVDDKFSNYSLLHSRERSMLQLFPFISSMHLLGGGYINDLHTENLKLIELVAFFSKKFSFPCYSTGLGLIPLSDGSASKLAESIIQYSLFDVRDLASFNAINKQTNAHISFIGDDFFCFPFSETVRLKESAQPALCLCINDESVNNPDERNEFLLLIESCIDDFISHNPGSPINLYEFRPGVDSGFWPRISQKYPTAKIFIFEDIWRDGLTFSKNDVFISTRFHFQLIVASLGLSGTSFYWNDYYKNKFESLTGLTSWSTFNLKEVRVSPAEILKQSSVSFSTEFESASEKSVLPTKIYGKK